MLGISNVFLQEDRMINDSRKKVEQHEVQDEDDSLWLSPYIKHWIALNDGPSAYIAFVPIVRV